MRCLLAILFSAVVFFSLNAGATIINVPDDYPTIQEGIDHGSDGDTVLVQPDTYNENVNFHEHSVLLASLFLTTGDTAYISSTIIDGDSAGSVITIESSEDRRAQVVGFTIQNGFAEDGGGIRCSGTSPAIRNNNIIDNFVLGENASGGGIGCYNSNIVIRDNRISGNSAEAWEGLATGCHVKLEVLNPLGQRVDIIVDELQQTGNKVARWDPSEVSSGIYFYKLTAGDFTETKRMLLVK